MGEYSRSPFRRRLLSVIAIVGVVAGGILVAPLSAQATASITVPNAVAQILADTNALRAAGGLAPLTESAAIDTVAQNWAAQMYANGALTHNPNYSTQIPAGWHSAGENIASGYSYTTVVEAWHQSPGHYANIMGNYNSIGIGYYQQGSQTYFVQDFGNYSNVPSPAASPAGPSTAALSFVLAAYTDILDRTPATTDSGVQWWATNISGGVPRTLIAAGITGSDEYRLMQITAAYQNVLGRAPDASGEAWWLSMMQLGALQPDDAHRVFLASIEFYQNQGGNTDGGYVTALYQDIISRVPDAAGLEYWTQVLQNGGRAAAVNGLWFSDETLRVQIDDAYQALLGRSASTSDQTFWLSAIRAVGPSGMRTILLGSTEYWNRAAVRFP